jgi:GT2 family glycosyltransferase
VDRRVSVVIVTFNAESSLPRLLASLRSDRGAPVAEVIVVDNGSVDATVAIARSDERIQLIEQVNGGYAYGVNRGIEAAAEGTDVLVLNPDVVLHEGSVERLLEAFENVDVGIAVPALSDESGHIAPSLRREPSVLRTLVEALVGGTRAGRFGESFRPNPAFDMQPADWATGAVMMLRRSMIKHIGLLDESFFLYSEETEYCLRARDAGYRLVCVPSATAVHLGGEMRSHPSLWALRAVNRVRLYARRHGRGRAVGFRLASQLFELRRAMSGDRVSRTAARLLWQPHLDAVAARLIRSLGGELRQAPAPKR